MEVLASNIMLGLVFTIGLLLSVTRAGATTLDAAALAVVAVLLAFVVFASWMLTRHLRAATAIVRSVAARVPVVTPDALETLIVTMASRLRDLIGSPRRLLLLAALGAGNWLFDAASLWVVLAAFGDRIAIGPLLAVYGLGSLLALLPITPGGLGIVEGVMVPALTAFGVPADIALLGVVGWRVLEFWLPIPLAGASYVSLRLTTLRKMPQDLRDPAPPTVPIRTETGA